MSRRKVLKEIVTNEVKPTSFIDYKPFLNSLFAGAKQKLEKYTYHEFAEDLGFSASNIAHQFIRGHRKLSAKAAATIVKSLEMKGNERRYFEALVDYCNTTTPAKREQLFQKMISEKNQVLSSDGDKDWLEYLSEWYHPVVKELVGFVSFKNDPQWISDQIKPRIRPEQAKKSLELLERLNFIEFDPKIQSYVPVSTDLSTGHEVRGIGFTRYHQKMIEMGRESLANVASRARDISATTVSIDEATFRRLKSMIHEFNERIIAESKECQQKDRIYQINIQFFPFATVEKDED